MGRSVGGALGRVVGLVVGVMPVGAVVVGVAVGGVAVIVAAGVTDVGATVGAIDGVVIGGTVGERVACSQSNDEEHLSSPAPGTSTHSPKRHSRCVSVDPWVGIAVGVRLGVGVGCGPSPSPRRKKNQIDPKSRANKRRVIITRGMIAVCLPDGFSGGLNGDGSNGATPLSSGVLNSCMTSSSVAVSFTGISEVGAYWSLSVVYESIG